jgi:hypothetical protein
MTNINQITLKLSIPCIFRPIREIAESDYQLRHVRLSDRMQQLGSHWTDIHDI